MVELIDPVTPIGGDILEFRLASGGSYSYDPGTALSDVVPTEQDILLAGTRNGTPWAFVVPNDVAGGSCHRVRAPAFVKERRVLFATGLSLPMAPEFDPSSVGPEGVWDYDQAAFCVSTEGMVLGYH